MKRKSILAFALVLSSLSLSNNDLHAQQFPFQDTSLTVEQRVDDLLSRLTLDEKIAFLEHQNPAVERLGIKPYGWWNEALHGIARNGVATVYPMPIALAATFNPQMVEEVYSRIADEGVRLIGCEAAGRGIDTFETAATINTGKLGIFHGMKSYFCQDEYGQIAPVYSISAGLDYPGVGPEHAHLHDIGRAEYVPVTDDEAVNAFEYLSRTEGIIPAIESAHAIAYAMKLAPTMDKDKIIIVTVSGRGDKDCAAIARYRGEDIYE
jgi:hypothetical protein